MNRQATPDTMSQDAVRDALARFHERALAGKPHFEISFDRTWRSECELETDHHTGTTRWRPLPQRIPVDFSGLENALGCTIHPHIKSWYGSFWSGHFEARSHEGPVSLIQLWNREDFDRLVANLIGHAMAKQKARLPLTVFFANTDPDSELFLSIDNESGKVLLEEPGKKPIKEVDDTVDVFVDRLSPLDMSPRMH